MLGYGPGRSGCRHLVYVQPVSSDLLKTGLDQEGNLQVTQCAAHHRPSIFNAY